VPARASILARFGSYEGFLRTILCLAILVTCGLTPIQTDTWWQLRAGRDMATSGRVLLTDTYSHTASGSYWVNHEWLAELVFYGMYRVGGLGLLTLFCGVLIAAGWMVSWAMRSGPVRPAFVLFLCALVSSSGWWEPRPHAFSLLFIPLTLFLIERNKYAWLPLVFLVWAQSHGGVLLGLALLMTGLTAKLLVDRESWKRALAAAAACVLAMTATPLGLHFWTEIPRSLSRINQYTLDEWMRPGLTEGVLIPFWGIAAIYPLALARSLWRSRRLDPRDVSLHACALVLLVAALGAVRNVGPFLMLACPALTRVWGLAASPAGSDAAADRTRPNLVIQVVAVAGVVMILAIAYRDNWPRLKWTPMPAPAVAALRECPGNLYNRYDEGGMLLWFAPERKVFLDGRQDPFPPALVLEHIEMETGKRGYRETFLRHDIRCVFLPVTSPVASQLSANEWRQLYRDPQWIVFAKR
jgi:hypothetical protein